MIGFLLYLLLALVLIALVSGAYYLLLLRAARIVGPVNPQTDVRLRHIGEGEFSARAPGLRATARLVIAEDHGRCYVVHSRVRGVGERVTYVPPAIARLRAHLAALSEERS